MSNERYLFNNEIENRHAVEDENQPRRARRSHGYGAAIVEQADYAVELLRQGVRQDVRAKLADEFGRFVDWQEVCRAANDLHKVALVWFE